jgi:hypothetical protein
VAGARQVDKVAAIEQTLTRAGSYHSTSNAVHEIFMEISLPSPNTRHYVNGMSYEDGESSLFSRIIYEIMRANYWGDWRVLAMISP